MAERVCGIVWQCFQLQFLCAVDYLSDKYIPIRLLQPTSVDDVFRYKTEVGSSEIMLLLRRAKTLDESVE